MTAKEFLDAFEAQASGQEVRLNENYRYHYMVATVTVTHKPSGAQYVTPYRAGLSTLKANQFTGNPRIWIAGTKVVSLKTLLEQIQKDGGLRPDTEGWMHRLANLWQPPKQSVLHALVNDALLYADYPDFGDFGSALGLEDCGKALEAYNASRATYEFFTLKAGYCVGDLRAISGKLDS